MAKVLIATIGTGRPTESGNSMREYSKARYKFKNELEEEHSFVVAALQKITKAEKFILLGTSKSMWEEVYRYFCELKGIPLDEEYYFQLGTAIEKLKINEELPVSLEKLEKVLGNGSKIIVLKYGLNENEMYENLQKLFKLLQFIKKDDEVYLDITHGFRTFAVFNFLSLILIKLIKAQNLKIKGIFYGNLEVQRELKYAPIVDVLSFYEMFEYTLATYEFSQYGNAYRLAELVENEKLRNSLIELTESFNLGDVNLIRNNLARVKSHLENNTNENFIFKNLLPAIQEMISKIQTNEATWIFLHNLALHYYEKRNYSNFLLCATEMVRYFVADKLGYAYIRDMEVSEEIKNYIENCLTFDYLKKFLGEDHAKINYFVQIKDNYKKLNSIRNKIAHKDAKKSMNLKNALQDSKIYFDSLSKILFYLKNVDLPGKS